VRWREVLLAEQGWVEPCGVIVFHSRWICNVGNGVNVDRVCFF
jgi:hypothetical protein